MATEQTLADSGIALIILAAGFTVAQLTAGIALRAYRTKLNIVSMDMDRRLKAVRYVIMTLTIVAALAYLRSDAIGNLLFDTASYLPDILTAVLIIVLGVVIVNFVISSIERVLRTIGLVDYATAYGKQQAVKMVLLGIKFFLYLVVVESTLSLLGVYSSALSAIIHVVIYGGVLLLVLLAFFGLRGLVENIIAGFYVKSISYFRPGQRLVIDGEGGEVSNVSGVDTSIVTDSGYVLIIPNKELLKQHVKFEKKKPEFRTLEDIKSHFVEQRPSYCGPACAQMVLSILKQKNVNQNQIAELAGTAVGKGTHPERLIRAVEEVTEGEVIGRWISVSKIIDLKQELKSWLHDGALVIPDFKKSMVFPTVQNDKAHYAVCVGMEDDDLIILDPSGSKGGVYLANHQDVHRGMNTYSKLLGGKRGYIVLAPHGTTAYWRMKKGLIYADRDLYDEIGKQLEEKFKRVVEKSRVFKNVLPESVRDYLREWDERYKVARLWRPGN